CARGDEYSQTADYYGLDSW
nr:immunoglobulin heavy chain junction region [Macaca mulatta]MOV53659.1 immunoglobulin heavy chain junction region [Macaca mulatta]MOV53904.1 immunoglobulin heavy chain junction region [Macaca mulatta]MOV54233.1 immunoglobulin heavy chain junction region [Macaca mulatta]MOV55017.1 immunoglobulin heavy chain junction region [Macaca mulatta]